VIRKVATCPARRVGCPSVAFPILDRRLVSFLLSIPFEQLARPGDLRSLQRRALGAMLPNIVAKRRSKRSPDSAVYRALLANWSFVETLLKDPVSVDAGYIDSCGLRVASERVRIGTFPATLFRVFLLFEQWLRTVPVFTPKRNPVEAVASTSY